MAKGKWIGISATVVIILAAATAAAFVHVPKLVAQFSETQLAAQDLSQQTLMAWGTWAIFVVSGLGVALSGLALFVLLDTLKQSALATLAAQHSADAVIRAERASLSITEWEVRIGSHIETGDGHEAQYLELQMALQNYGRSYASDVHVTARIAFPHPTMPKSPAALDGISGFSSQSKLPRPIEHSGRTSLTIPFDIIGNAWNEVEKKTVEAVIYGRITFFDIFRKEQRFLTYGFVYRFDLPGGPSLYNIPDPIFWESN